MNEKPPLERIQESEKLLERLTLVLPGFRGYKLKEQRREADKIVRNHVYEQLEQSQDDLTKCFQAFSDKRISELLEPMNRLLAILDRVAQKVNYASYGYSGFFDSIKIEEPELDRMLTYDTQLMDSARKFAQTARSFMEDVSQNKVENARAVEQVLETNLREMESAFDLRKSIIEAVKV